MLVRTDDPRSTPAWFTTFADMNMLLMVFFIMLFSLLSADKSRYLPLRERLEGVSGRRPAGDEPATGHSSEGARSLGTLLERFERREPAEPETLRAGDHEMLLQRIAEGTLLTVGGGVDSFPEGGWMLSASQRDALAGVKRWLEGRRNVIEVRGHTSANLEDSVILEADGRVRRFGPDDLERPDRMRAANHSLLSWLRAEEVRKFLAERHPELDDRVRVPELRLRVRAEGYARAVADSAVPARRPLNRRIEILVTPEIPEN